MKSLTKLMILATIIFSTLMLTSCLINIPNRIVGEGDIITDTLSVADFSGINLATVPNVTIKQGTTQLVRAIGYANIIEKVKTDVSNNIWTIKFQEGYFYSKINLSIEIIVPDISSITSSSTGNIIVENFNNQNTLTLSTSSTGDITINNFEGISELEASISSVGSIKANEDITSLSDLDVNISSSGNFNGFPITSENCTLSVSSSGNAKITANNTLDVTISSSGNVYYKGNPSITQNITSSGRLINSN